MEEAFNNWKRNSDIAAEVTLENLYIHQETAKRFADEYAEMMAMTAVYGFKGMMRNIFPLVTKERWADYVGKNAENQEEYKKKMEEYFLELLTSAPESRLMISYQPDGICGACQGGDRESGFGNHCIDEIGAFHDYTWNLALDNMSNFFRIRVNGEDEWINKVLTESGPAFEISFGALRSQRFLRFLEGQYTVTEKYVGESFGLLTAIGILREDRKLLYRVTEAYIRGERGN